MTRYMDCIDSTPPSTVLQVADCLHGGAICGCSPARNRYCLRRGQAVRSYIQAILKRYAKSKLDTLAKVKADEEAHEQRKSRSTSAVNRYAGPTQEEFEKMKQLAKRLSQA